ncbi:nuclear transport factor 2 family protein [Bacteroidota bacterium]
MNSKQTKEPNNMKTAKKNVKIIRASYEAFNTADMETLTANFHENASWHTPGRSRIAGDHVGRDAVFTQFGRYGGETAGTFKATLQNVFRSKDGRVVGVHHNSAERNGKHLDTGCCIVFELKDGRIISGTEYIFDLHNWDDFWS